MRWFGHRRYLYDKLISTVYPYISSDAIVFDIGANIGYFTMLLAERLEFKRGAYLFEPVPNLAELCRITFHNASFAVTVCDFGLSDKDMEENIFLNTDGNIGANSLVKKSISEDRMSSIRLKPFDTC